MEVIKSGIDPSTWTKKVVCPRCNTHLRISWRDIYIQTTRKQTIISYKHVLHYRIKCMKCNCTIELNDEDLPYIIRKKVYDNMDIVDKILNFYFS